MTPLILALLIPIYIAGAALLNRYRGNGDAWGPDWPHTVKRLIVAGWLTLPFACVLPFWQMVIINTLIFAAFLPGWGAYFDFINPREPEVWWIDRLLKRLDLNYEMNDLAAMSLRGLHFTVPPVVFLLVLGAPTALLLTAPAGLLMGLVYWAFYRVKLPGDRIAQAEWAWGAVLATNYAAVVAI